MGVLLNVQYLSLHSDVYTIHMNATDVFPTSFEFFFSNGPVLSCLESLYARINPNNLWLAEQGRQNSGEENRAAFTSSPGGLQTADGDAVVIFPRNLQTLRVCF